MEVQTVHRIKSSCGVPESVLESIVFRSVPDSIRVFLASDLAIWVPDPNLARCFSGPAVAHGGKTLALAGVR